MSDLNDVQGDQSVTRVSRSGVQLTRVSLGNGWQYRTNSELPINSLRFSLATEDPIDQLGFD